MTPSTAVISVEPVPDNSPAPFSIKPLVGMVGADAAGTLVGLGQNLDTVPYGTVSINQPASVSVNDG